MSKTSTEALLTAYRSLPLPERQVLQLLAFFAAPISRSPLVAMLTQLRIRFAPTRAINAKDLVDFFGRTRQMGLTVEQQGNFRCQREIQFQLIRQCQLEGLFGEYCSLVAKQMENDYYRSQEHALQLLRLGFFMHKPDKVTTALSVLRRYYSHDASIIAVIFPERLDTDWVIELPPLLMSSLINALLLQTISKLNPTSAFAILDQLKATARLSSDLSYSYPVYLTLQGRFSEVEQAITEPGMNQYQGHRGMLALLQGKVDQAISCFEQKLLIIKKQTGKRKIVLPGILGLMHCLALLAGGLPQQLSQTIELASIGLKRDEYTEKSAYTYILLTAEARSGNTRSATTLKDFCGQTYELLPVSQLIRALCGWWQQLPLPQEQLNSLRNFAMKARDAGMLWLAAQLLLVARTIDPVGTNNTEWAENLSKELQMVNLASLARDDQQSWERSLNALLQLGKTGNNTATASKENDSRLIWLIDGDIRTNFAQIQPVEQKLSSKGWSRGRNVALKRMAEEPGKLPFLTHQDLAAAACIRKERSYGYYSQTSYDFNTIKALKALIGHPLLFNHRNEPMTIAKGEFAISVKKKGAQLSLSMSPALNADSQPFSWWESENRLLVYEPTAEQRRIAGIIGKGLNIPQKAEKQVAAAVTAVSPHLMIQSDLITVSDEAISVEADSRLHILLRPSGEGIQAELRVQPFGEQGPQFRPGQGGSTVIAEVDGKKLHCLRNLLEEKQHHKLLMQTCSTFDLYDSEHETWRIENPDGTLELLEELQALMQTEPDCLCCTGRRESALS